MATIELLGINKIYPNGFHAVKDVSLTIEDGEFMVLVGPSGCAKSTTLNMIAGLEEITSGEIRIDGKRVNELPAKDRDIAMVFQSYALYPHMNVFDNMAFGLKLRRRPKKEIRERVHNTAELLDISQFLKRKPKALSGGQRQRVALGRAIVRNPKVFLFDEPLSNLDAKLRGQMRVELAKLHSKIKNTVVYVTHDQVEAMTMGTKICVMNAGRVEQVAPPVQVYNKPSSSFVATFIGSPTMNVVGANLKKSDEAMTATLPNGHPLPLSAHHSVTLSSHEGKAITLGLRPEHIEVLPQNDMKKDEPSGTVINADADLIERMGSEAYVYFTFGNLQFIATAPAETDIRKGQNLNFLFHMDKAHFFDPQNDVVLLSSSKEKAA